jgi:RNA polymerase sigma-70 factor (ECF subfamily)
MSPFESCFRSHYADVLAFSLRRISGRQAAEDVVAETFAIIWRRRERIPDPALPWLYGIAVRVIANQRRSARRRANLEDRLTLEAGAAAPAGDLNEALHRRTAFATAFRALSDAERQVLCLIAWDGLDPREAAVVLACSYGAFRVRFHRARRKLAKQLAAAGHLPRQHCPRPQPRRGDQLKAKTPDNDVTARMRAANPVSSAVIRAGVDEEELRRAMETAIAAGESATDPAPAGDPVANRSTRSRRPGAFSQGRGRRTGLLAGLACAGALALVVVVPGEPGGGGQPAFAAAAIEVAEANPRLLVTEPGWTVTNANEFEAAEGEVSFGDGAHTFSIHWYPARMYRDYLRDRADVSFEETSSVLGHTATTVHYGGTEYATMLSPQGGRVRGGPRQPRQPRRIRRPASLAAPGRRRHLARRDARQRRPPGSPRRRRRADAPRRAVAARLRCRRPAGHGLRLRPLPGRGHGRL